MIDYQVLCQTIAEWKAGQRPASGPHDQAAANPEEVEEMASGLVVMDDEAEMTYEEMPAQEVGYEQEGEVTYGDEQAAAEYGEEAAPEAEPEYEEVAEAAEPEYEEVDEDIAVDTDDDDEIPVE